MQQVEHARELKPPLSAAQAAKLYPRAHKAALAAQHAKPNSVFVSYNPVATDGDWIDQMRRK